MTDPRTRWASDLRAVADFLLDAVRPVPDDSWDLPAAGLTWTCRETAAHLMDDWCAYALQVSGRDAPAGGYVPLIEAARDRPDGPAFLLLPERESGTAGVVAGLDAAAGLLVAVAATAPPDRIGWHPYGSSDGAGFAAMGALEGLCHGHDIVLGLCPDRVHLPDPQLCVRVLDRLLPGAERSSDPWRDLLGATGRTPETRGRPWRWSGAVPD